MKSSIEVDNNKNEIVSVSNKSNKEFLNNYFIFKSNEKWDQWFQKLFSQFISVKVWVILISVFLVLNGNITGGEFTTIISIIMGVKGGFAIADVWKKKGTHNILDR